jgi:hypothetical protein
LAARELDRFDSGKVCQARLNSSAENVALELFIFPIPTSPALVPQAQVVDLVSAPLPFALELA